MTSFVVSSEDVDLLVIGSGIAGCSSALKAAEMGASVKVLTSSANPLSSNSYWAQGGIIYKAANEKPEELASDIKIAGAGLTNPSAALKLAEEGPARVEEMLLNGDSAVQFDRNTDGELSLCLEGSHSQARIIHWQDHTGKAIMQSMIRAVENHPRIELVRSVTAIDLLTADMRQDEGTDTSRGAAECAGARVLNHATGEVMHVTARATILATGGLGEVFGNTSNPSFARGDGVAMAIRAGARVSNLEYVQFHPTTLYVEGESQRFLLTEALRGEGARLLDPVHMKPFARKYHPKGELAPRDVVSRMISKEMQDHGAAFVYLDISHRDPDWLRSRFPSIYQHCLNKGLDMTKQPLPVLPAAHYSCGGVEVDLQGKTSIRRLFAVGEVACSGLHGANRLASTSLLEGVVWGCAAVEEFFKDYRPGGLGLDEGNVDSQDAAAPSRTALPEPSHQVSTSQMRDARGKPSDLDDEDAETANDLPRTRKTVESKAECGGDREACVPVSVKERTGVLWAQVKQVMWTQVGIVRTPEALQDAVVRLASLVSDAEDLYREFGAQGVVSNELIGIRNGVTVALAIASAASGNPTSAGAHFVLPPDHSEEEAAPNHASARRAES